VGSAAGQSRTRAAALHVALRDGLQRPPGSSGLLVDGSIEEGIMTMDIDEDRLGELMGTLGLYMTGGAMCLAMWMGDELGLYRAMAGAGAVTSDEVAARTGCNPRLVREWLDGQAAGGLVAYVAEADRYTLSTEAATALADDTSPVFVARAMNAVGSTFIDFDKIVGAFRGDGGLAWGDHSPCLFAGTEWFFRTGYRAELPSWIEALDGTADRLRAGGTVADVGCGHGASVVVMAQAFPEARIHGFDYHAPSIETARLRAKEASAEGSTEFSVAGAKDFEGAFDLICFFDCLHDMGDPVGIASHARAQLTDDGAVLLVEPFALKERTTNLVENPMAALLYTVSSAVCTPNSLSQEVGLGLGAQAGEGRLQEVFEQAGFTRFRKVAETPMNLIIEAKV
jgi:2-polyprenyl-3-methyl-5-hydroxy-6-metoxy-1,4-benzoquinol methylase